ncbi:MAG: enoyl-CoA hydratase/isomerase family protein [Phycisphaerales bacterium]|nr:enoyl-CoA hydratase/isomerase family protein [Phycisphaerales bacterium]
MAASVRVATVRDMDALVDLTIDGPTATITLNRPEARNALSLALINELHRVLDQLEQNPDVRVLLIKGEGKSFCAGMDLKGVMQDPQAMAAMLHGLARAFERIRRLSMPSVAVVQGAAVGGGCGLMIVCDFAISHPDAKIGYPEVDLGVCPAVVAPWLIRKIGAGKARSLLLSGGTRTGQDGLELGLLTHLTDHGSLNDVAERLATELSQGGMIAMKATKKWLNELDGSMEDEIHQRAAQISADVIAHSETQQQLRKVFKA